MPQATISFKVEPIIIDKGRVTAEEAASAEGPRTSGVAALMAGAPRGRVPDACGAIVAALAQPYQLTGSATGLHNTAAVALAPAAALPARGTARARTVCANTTRVIACATRALLGLSRRRHH
ncbi:hypothetical protein ACJJTC_015474 [Scirpophaga incertulas]